MINPKNTKFTNHVIIQDVFRLFLEIQGGYKVVRLSLKG